MSSRQITRNIELTPQLDRLVRTKVASGRYESASEVVRDGLRLLEARDKRTSWRHEQLRREIELGWQQSERGAVVDGAGVFEEIRRMSKGQGARSK